MWCASPKPGRAARQPAGSRLPAPDSRVGRCRRKDAIKTIDPRRRACTSPPGVVRICAGFVLRSADLCAAFQVAAHQTHEGLAGGDGQGGGAVALIELQPARGAGIADTPGGAAGGDGAAAALHRKIIASGLLVVLLVVGIGFIHRAGGIQHNHVGDLNGAAGGGGMHGTVQRVAVLLIHAPAAVIGERHMIRLGNPHIHRVGGGGAGLGAELIGGFVGGGQRGFLPPQLRHDLFLGVC